MGMDEYIDKSALYDKIAQLEDLARNRYLETPSNSPCYSRYMAQLNERTAFKHIIADSPSADVAPVHHGRWLVNGYVCGETEYQCSACKETEWRTSSSILKFCPFCGAKMDLEEA